MADMTGPENSPESPVTTNQRGIPKQPIRLSRGLLGCIRSDMLWPHWSGVFHVDAVALNLEFQLITLIENIYISLHHLGCYAPSHAGINVQGWDNI